MESIKSFFEKFQMTMEEKVVPVASRSHHRDIWLH